MPENFKSFLVLLLGSLTMFFIGFLAGESRIPQAPTDVNPLAEKQLTAGIEFASKCFDLITDESDKQTERLQAKIDAQTKAIEAAQKAAQESEKRLGRLCKSRVK